MEIRVDGEVKKGEEAIQRRGEPGEVTAARSKVTSTMLNPLLHTSSSAPTSPLLTRSIHVQPAASGVQSKAVVGANAIVAAVVARRPGRQHSGVMQRLSRDSSPANGGVPVVGVPSSASAAASSSSREEAVRCWGDTSSL